jgi:hypothetical protein
MPAPASPVELLTKIIAFNHCWKMAQQRYGNSSALAKMLRDQKSILQASLLRENLAYLRLDPEADEEALFSVRLNMPVVLNGVTRIDAEHMPVRLAEEFFTEQELKKMLSTGI